MTIPVDSILEVYETLLKESKEREASGSIWIGDYEKGFRSGLVDFVMGLTDKKIELNKGK